MDGLFARFIAMVERCFFFFFQAEDGIRDYKVTGVQTCALPIWLRGIFGSPTAPCATLSDMLLARTARRMATSTPGITRRREIQPGPSAVRRARTQQAPRNEGVLLGDPELTMRSKINFLGCGAAIRDHCSMQLCNGLATGLDEQERENGVHETGTRRQKQLAAEPRRPQQMPP